MSIVFLTEKRLDFIKNNCSRKLLDSYKKVRIGAAQADIWRLAVLYHHGGVYLDIDAHLIRPLLSIIRQEDYEVYVYLRTGEISNYFLASQKGNEKFQRVLNRILKNIQEDKKGVYEMTGPGAFINIINFQEVRKENYRITCHQGNFTNEYFQYIDKSEPKWTCVAQNEIIRVTRTKS